MISLFLTDDVMKKKYMRYSFFLLSLIFSSNIFSAPPPSNDNPCNAILLPVNLSCTFISGTNVGATATSGVTNPSCNGNYNGGDVWFKAVVPSNGILKVTTQATSTISDGAMAFYSGNCTSLTEILCDRNSAPGSGSMPEITATGLTPNDTIWIRFWESNNNDFGSFDICATTIASPLNDNSCKAIFLQVENLCNFVTGTNVNATASNVPDPGCGNYAGGDVWYKTVVPANGYLNFNTQASGVTNAAMAIYKGTCNALTLLACDENDGTGNMPEVSLLSLTPNDTIWIRIWEEGNNTFGTFGVCVTSQNIVVPPSCSSNAAAGNTCATATTICNLDGYCGNTSSSYTADYWSELNSTFQSCVNGIINNDSYLKFTAGSTSASFNIWVTSSSGGDGIQMMFFEANNCAGTVICHGGYDNLLPSIQPHLVNATSLIPGRTYYLMIDGVHGDECNYVIKATAGLSTLYASSNAAICKGENITLSAGGIPGVDSIYHWTWMDENGNSQLSVGSVLHDTPVINTVYTVTAYGIGICPQTKTVQVIVKPIPHAIILPPDTNQLSCSITNIQLNATGGVAYTWNNGNQIIGNDSFSIVITPANYLVTVTASNGCKDTASIAITQDITNPTVSINTPDTTILNCNITLIQLIANGLGSFIWNNGSANLGTDSILQVNSPGNYTVQLTGLNGCTSNQQIVITQDMAIPIGSVTATPSSVLTCSQNSINLSATGGVNYSWSNGSSIVSSSASFSVNTPATYTLQLTGLNGCTSNQQIVITQDIALPIGSVTATPSSVLTCSQNSINLSATGGVNYSWSNGSSIVSSSASFSVNTPAIYTLQLTGLNGCTSNQQIVITQDIALPVVVVTATPTSVLTCSQNSINLSATGGVNYSWNNGSSIVSSSASFSVNTPANYTVTVKGNNGCENNAFINVTQNVNLPDASVTNNGAICKGDNAVFTIIGTPGAVVYYTLNNSNSQNITLNPSGTAQLTIPLPSSDQSIQLNSVSLNGCSKNLNVISIIPLDNFSINLNVNPLLTNPGNDISAQITSNGTIATSTWLPSNLFNQNLSSQTIAAPDQTFLIEVTATSANGCVANQSQIVEIISTNNIYYIPNSFIPGSSGNSDINNFKLYGTSIKKATMQIFNQWGQCIFESENPHIKGWDGKYKGNMQPSGVYVYTVKIIFNNKKTVVKSGSINLIR